MIRAIFTDLGGVCLSNGWDSETRKMTFSIFARNCSGISSGFGWRLKNSVSVESSLPAPPVRAAGTAPVGSTSTSYLPERFPASSACGYKTSNGNSYC